MRRGNDFFVQGLGLTDCFLFFLVRKNSNKAMRATATIPPTTPPTMAPTFEPEPDEEALVVVMLAEGGGVVDEAGVTVETWTFVTSASMS